MRVLLVGHGGREAALAWKIAQSQKLQTLFVVGHNPGFPSQAVVRPCEGVDAICALAVEEQVELVVVGPEVPLSQGLADRLASLKIPCFGPQQAAARLETSKLFAKEIMAQCGVATAPFIIAHRDDQQAAVERCQRGRVVLKVDGLAAGKGVFVCDTADEAVQALEQCFGGRFGAASERVLLEDRIRGPEVSLFALSDGKRVVALPSAQDHKRLLDGQKGPNTGGMGAYCPCPLVSPVQVEQWVQEIHQPVVDAMAARGTPFVGVLYAGLMLTSQGPVVLEFNVRFGDPECQPLMCLWKDDILPWLQGAAVGQLPAGSPEFYDASACCVVIASKGYPESKTVGVPIVEPGPIEGVQPFLAGTSRDQAGTLRTAGGRVLGITGVGPTLKEARSSAYQAVEQWNFEGGHYRTDIGAQGLLSSC